MRHGGWEEADAILPEAMAPTTSWGVGRADALAAFAHIQALRGDAPGAERSLREVDRAMREAVGSMWTAPTATARAEAAFWDGRPAVRVRSSPPSWAAARRSTTQRSGISHRSSRSAPGPRRSWRRARATGESEALADAVRRAGELRDIGRRCRRRSPPEARCGWIRHGRGRPDRATASAEEWMTFADRWKEYGAAFRSRIAVARRRARAGRRGSRGEVPRCSPPRTGPRSGCGRSRCGVRSLIWHGAPGCHSRR